MASACSLMSGPTSRNDLRGRSHHQSRALDPPGAAQSSCGIRSRLSAPAAQADGASSTSAAAAGRAEGRSWHPLSAPLLWQVSLALGWSTDAVTMQRGRSDRRRRRPTPQPRRTACRARRRRPCPRTSCPARSPLPGRCAPCLLPGRSSAKQSVGRWCRPCAQRRPPQLSSERGALAAPPSHRRRRFTTCLPAS